MNGAQGRLNIAQARLAVLGDPEPGEPIDVTQKREHYRKMLDEAHAEIAEAQRATLPYKEDD